MGCEQCLCEVLQVQCEEAHFRYRTESPSDPQRAHRHSRRSQALVADRSHCHSYLLRLARGSARRQAGICVTYWTLQTNKHAGGRWGRWVAFRLYCFGRCGTRLSGSQCGRLLQPRMANNQNYRGCSTTLRSPESCTHLSPPDSVKLHDTLLLAWPAPLCIKTGFVKCAVRTNHKERSGGLAESHQRTPRVGQAQLGKRAL